jgi:hypothetical protein
MLNPGIGFTGGVTGHIPRDNSLPKIAGDLLRSYGPRQDGLRRNLSRCIRAGLISLRSASSEMGGDGGEFHVEVA